MAALATSIDYRNFKDRSSPLRFGCAPAAHSTPPLARLPRSRGAGAHDKADQKDKLPAYSRLWSEMLSYQTMQEIG